MIKIRLVAILAFALNTRGFAQSFSSGHWFSPTAAEAQKSFESRLNAVPAPASLRQWHDMLGSVPHIAGSPADLKLIDDQVKAFRDMGLEVTTHEFWALLAKPVEAKLQLIDRTVEGGHAAEAVHREPGERAEPSRRGVTVLPLREDDLLNDPYSAHPDLTWGWNAYSGSGSVTASIVYANYGTKEDFDTLKKLGIDCVGKIVLARYGQNFRGYKAKFAEQAGAAGLIIFTDPDDSGYRKGVPFPEGGWANDTCVQRGSIVTLDWPGDPLTPGTPATKDAERLDAATIALPRIPVQPIGYRAAEVIMKRMTGTPLPPDLIKTWQGGLPCAYRLTGGDDVELSLTVNQSREITRSANVIATLPGSKFPDEKIIIGCHHDAWGYGAGDPLAGTILVFEAAKSFAALAKQGIRPERTIVFATWGAEEFGIIGSTEYCEQYRDELMRDAVAYINLDAAAMGPNFGAGAAPSLKRIIAEVTKYVPQARTTTNQTVFDAWRAAKESPEIGNLGGGSDHVGFYCHLGIASCHLSSGGAPGTAYHSNYDHLGWYRQTVGDDYEPALMLTRIVNLLAARLANATVLPLDAKAIGDDFITHLDALAKSATEQGKATPDLAPLRVAAQRLVTDAESLNAALTDRLAKGELTAEQLGLINDRLQHLERDWIVPTGLPGRPWWRNLFAAADPDAGYAPAMLPGLRATVLGTSGEHVEEVLKQYERAMNQLGLRVQEATNAIAAR